MTDAFDRRRQVLQGRISSVDLTSDLDDLERMIDAKRNALTDDLGGGTAEVEALLKVDFSL